jgi:hypothetical protein
MAAGLPFTYITDELPSNVKDAIFERFGRWPVSIIEL